jgi:alpha-beta hydrolase superfamily lysophospholipase
MTSRGWAGAAGCAALVGAGLLAAGRGVRRKYGHPPRWHTSLDPGRVPPAAIDIDMLPVSEKLSALGLHVLLLDARGHGRSDDGNVASMPAFAEDVRAALGWMRSAPQVDPSRIVLVGHSVGAGACLFVASGDPEIAAVVSLASKADPSSFMAQRLRHRLPGPLTGLALRYVEHTIGHRSPSSPRYTPSGRSGAPVLLVHGLLESTVPISDAYRLHAQAPERSTLIVVPDGDHLSTHTLETAGPDLVRFLENVRLIETPRSQGNRPG